MRNSISVKCFWLNEGSVKTAGNPQASKKNKLDIKESMQISLLPHRVPRNTGSYATAYI